MCTLREQIGKSFIKLALLSGVRVRPICKCRTSSSRKSIHQPAGTRTFNVDCGHACDTVSAVRRLRNARSLCAMQARAARRRLMCGMFLCVLSRTCSGGSHGKLPTGTCACAERNETCVAVCERRAICFFVGLDLCVV